MPQVHAIPRELRDTLGEGPVWSPSRNAVLWVDIFGQQVHELALEKGSITNWPVAERIGWLIERDGREDFVAGLKSGFAHLQIEPFSIRRIGNPEPDRPQNRLNDAKTDAAGRIWAGSKDDDDQIASGALYRLDPDFTWSRHDDGYMVTNGPAFSPDGKTMYHNDSGRRTVYAFDIDERSELSRRRVFATFEEEWGYPDGMATDAEGGIWVAHWGGGRISRFRPDGTLDRSVALPASNITSVVFAGPHLERMFVTSAAHGCESEPLAGALFEVEEAGVRGHPVRPFAG
ncbi:MAG: SMP-30/gluconolactonase/LRE family protein [Terracidiphilus sp.]